MYVFFVNFIFMKNVRSGKFTILTLIQIPVCNKECTGLQYNPSFDSLNKVYKYMLINCYYVVVFTVFK